MDLYSIILECGSNAISGELVRRDDKAEAIKPTAWQFLDRGGT